MTLPTITARVAFDTDPLAPTPTWTDLSDRLRTLRIRIGRTGDSADNFPPGSSTGVFKNADRALDPLDTAGTYYGKLTPNRRINYRVTHADVGTVDLFSGFVEDFLQDWFQPRYAETELAAVDGFSMLARIRAPASVHEIEVEASTPSAWYPLDDPARSLTMTERANGLDGSYLLVPSLQQDSLLANESGTAVLFPGTDSDFYSVEWAGRLGLGVSGTAWSIELWLKRPPWEGATSGGHVFMQDSGQASQLIYLWIGGPDNGDNLGKIEAFVSRAAGSSVTIYSSGRVDDNAAHHVVLTRNGTTISLYTDGVLNATGTLSANTASVAERPAIGSGVASSSGTLYLPANVTLDAVALYSTALSGPTVLTHYQAGTAPWDRDEISARINRYLDLAGWPSALRDLDISPTTLGSATLNAAPILDLVQQAARTDQGWFWQAPDGTMTLRTRTAPFTDARAVTSQATFTDDPAAVGAYRYTDLILEPANIRQVRNIITVNWTGGSVVERDQTSVDAYGPAEHTIDTICATEGEARALAQWQLLHFKDPATRVRGVVVAGKTGTWAAVLGLRIGDRVSIRRHPQLVHSAFTFDAFIEGIEHDISDGRTRWTTTFHLGPVEPYTYWVLGTSALGTGTRLSL